MVEDIEYWYELIARALRQNLILIIVIIGKFINMTSLWVYPRLHKGPYSIREER